MSRDMLRFVSLFCVWQVLESGQAGDGLTFDDEEGVWEGEEYGER